MMRSLTVFTKTAVSTQDEKQIKEQHSGGDSRP